MMGMMVAMAACTSDDEVTASSGEGTDNLPLRVVITGGNVGAEGGNTTSTSTGTLLPAGAKMKLYEWAGSATFTEGSKTANGGYEMLSTGVLQEPATPMKWLAANTDHHFLAVSPSRDITNFSADEFALGSAPESFLDLLVWRTGAPVQSRNANNEVNSIDVELHHLMAKLVVNFTLNDELQEQTIQYVKAKNVNYKALINYTKELTDGTPDYLSMVAPDETVQRTDFPLTIVGNTKTYYQVMVPQEGVTTIEITMHTTSGDRTYLYTHKDAQGNVADIPLKSGQVTTLNLALGRTALTLGDITVKPWTTTVIADEVPDYDTGYQTSIEDGLTWYNVTTYEGLYSWANAVKINRKACLRLMNDITLPMRTLFGEPITLDSNGIPNGSNWAPVGDENYSFIGKVDGQGHSIGNMLIKRRSSSAGFFGTVGDGGTTETLIQGLHLKDVAICVYGNGKVGALASIADGVTFENCSAAGKTFWDEYMYSTWGGLVGFTLSETKMIACWNEVSIALTGYNWVLRCGGLVGCDGYSIDAPSTLTLIGCYNCGDLSAVNGSGSYVGGLIGYVDTNSTGTLYSCYNSGALSTASSTGFICGSLVGTVHGLCSSLKSYYANIGRGSSGSGTIGGDNGIATDDLTSATIVNEMNSSLDYLYNNGATSKRYNYYVNTDEATKAVKPLLIKEVTE